MNNHNNTDFFPAVHPGAVLLDELQERGISQVALAKHIEVLPKTINEICNKKRGISFDMAYKLSHALGGSVRFWVNLQTNWELSNYDEKSYKRITVIA